MGVIWAATHGPKWWLELNSCYYISTKLLHTCVLFLQIPVTKALWYGHLHSRIVGCSGQLPLCQCYQKLCQQKESSRLWKTELLPANLKNMTLETAPVGDWGFCNRDLGEECGPSKGTKAHLQYCSVHIMQEAVANEPATSQQMFNGSINTRTGGCCRCCWSTSL